MITPAKLPKWDQDDCLTYLESLQTEAANLAAKLKAAGKQFPEPPAVTGDVLLDVDGQEAHTVNLRVLLGLAPKPEAAKPGATAKVKPSLTAKCLPSKQAK
jgi:hypothetical protein